MNDNMAYNVPALLHALRTKNVSEQQLDAAAVAYPPSAPVIPNTGVISRMPMAGIHAPHPHDVLAGRGKSINHHPGNQYFISLIKPLKTDYVATPKQEKSMFARMVIQKIKNLKPPGRFLKQDPQTGLWFDIGEKKAILKTRQALREGAPEIEKLLKNGEIVAKMKDSMDPLSVKRALDKIVKPTELSEIEPPFKKQKSPESEKRSHVVDSISFDKKYHTEVPDNAAELLISFAADSSNAAAAQSAALRNSASKKESNTAKNYEAGASSGADGRTPTKNAHATVDEAMLLVSVPNGDRHQTPMPPLGGGKEEEVATNRRVSFKAPLDINATNNAHAALSDSPNRRVSYKAQENSAQTVALLAQQVKFGGMGTDGGNNRRVSYKIHEEIDKAGSKDGAETEDNKSDNRRVSFTANSGAARHSGVESQGVGLVPQHSKEDGDSNRRASFLGQQDLDAFRRASAASQDLVMMTQRYQNDLATAGSMTHPGIAAAQKLGMALGPQGYQDGNDMGYPNRRVSFVSQHDLDFARRSSILNDALVKQNILGYSEAGPSGRQGGINMAGLPFLQQQMDSRRGSFLAHEILLQNQLLGGADGNSRRNSAALQNSLAMMQQQGNQNLPGITEEGLKNRRLNFQASQNLGALHHANTNGNAHNNVNSKVGGDISFPPKREGEALIEGSVMIPGVGNRRVSMTAEQFNALQAAQGNPGIETTSHNNSQQSPNQKSFTSL